MSSSTRSAPSRRAMILTDMGEIGPQTSSAYASPVRSCTAVMRRHAATTTVRSAAAEAGPGLAERATEHLVVQSEEPLRRRTAGELARVHRPPDDRQTVLLRLLGGEEVGIPHHRAGGALEVVQQRAELLLRL